MMNFSVREIPYSEFVSAVKFYIQVGYMGGIQPQDRVVVASANGKTVGIGRIAYEHNTAVLRGMQVEKEMQRQGIGNLLLDKLAEILGDDTCYCMPHDWLERFYGRVGFKRLNPDEAPNFLKKRLEVNKSKYPHLILMARDVKKIRFE